jgi:hypothetical protein
MPPSALPVGSADLRGFTKRAVSVKSNAGLYQLVEDLARAVDRQSELLQKIANHLGVE